MPNIYSWPTIITSVLTSRNQVSHSGGCYITGVPSCSNDFWNLYKGKSMPGGVSAGTLASSFACVAACEGLSNCVAANWNSASSACSTFTDSIPDIASTATDVATSSFYARCSVSSHCKNSYWCKKVLSVFSD